MELWAEAPVDEASKAAGAEERLAKCHLTFFSGDLFDSLSKGILGQRSKLAKCHLFDRQPFWG